MTDHNIPTSSKRLKINPTTDKPSGPKRIYQPQLFNPLTSDYILEMIMKYLDESELKRCRLVSKQWNTEAVKIIAKRDYNNTAVPMKASSYLELSLEENLVHFQKLLNQVKGSNNPQLLRMISFHWSWLSKSKNIRPFLKKYARYLKGLEFQMTQYLATPQQLGALDFLLQVSTQLQKLSITITKNTTIDNPGRGSAYKSKVLPVQSLNLEEVRIGQEDYQGETEFHDLFKRILLSSPKVKKLEVYKCESRNLLWIIDEPHLLQNLQILKFEVSDLLTNCALNHFDKLHTLEISLIETPSGQSWDLLLKAVANTLKDLTIVKQFFMTSCELFPQRLTWAVDKLNRLESLRIKNWPLKPICDFVHAGKVFLKDSSIEKMTIEGFSYRSDMQTIRMESLNDIAPKLKSLKLETNRSTKFTVGTRQKFVIDHEKELSSFLKFKNLQALEIRIENVKNGNQVFRAMKKLAYSKSLRDLDISYSRANERSTHIKLMRADRLKDALIALKHFNSITLKGFHYLFREQLGLYMVKKYAENENFPVQFPCRWGS